MPRKDIERRFIPAGELRVAGDGSSSSKRITGYAAKFNSLSEDLGGFREQIAPGAFANTIKSADVRALFNHDANLILGRTKAGTLRLREDDVGLAYEIDPPNTQAARDLAESINRGDISQNSFGFSTIADEWRKNSDETWTRTLKEVELFDISPVTYPAYPQTDIAMRALSAVRAACGSLDWPLSDRERAWSASEADARLRAWATSDGSGDKDKVDWNKYASAHFWRDDADPEHFGSYKLAFADVVEGRVYAVWRAVAACAAVMQGGRGGVDIPDGDKPGVRAKIAAYYAKAAKAFADDTIKAPWEGNSVRELEWQADLELRRRRLLLVA